MSAQPPAHGANGFRAATKTLTGDVDVTAALSDAALTVTLAKNRSGMPKGKHAGAVYFGPSVDRMIAFVNLDIG